MTGSVDERLAELERAIERVTEAVAAFAASRRVEITGVRLELHVGGGEGGERRGDHLRPVE